MCGRAVSYRSQSANMIYISSCKSGAYLPRKNLPINIANGDLICPTCGSFGEPGIHLPQELFAAVTSLRLAEAASVSSTSRTILHEPESLRMQALVIPAITIRRRWTYLWKNNAFPPNVAPCETVDGLRPKTARGRQRTPKRPKVHFAYSAVSLRRFTLPCSAS